MTHLIIGHDVDSQGTEFEQFIEKGEHEWDAMKS